MNVFAILIFSLNILFIFGAVVDTDVNAEVKTDVVLGQIVESEDCIKINKFFDDYMAQSKSVLEIPVCCVNSEHNHIQCENGNITDIKLRINHQEEQIDFSNFPNLSHLQKIILEGHIFKDGLLPSVFFEMENLKELHVVNSNIKTITKDIPTSCPSETIDLFNNTFIGFPTEITNCSNLKHLDLSINNIGSVPDDIGKLKNLHTLYIGKTQLKSVSDQIYNLKLDNLDLSGCPDLSFKAYNFAKKIRECDLRDTNILCYEKGTCENLIKVPDDYHPVFFPDTEAVYPTKCQSGTRNIAIEKAEKGSDNTFMIVGGVAAIIVIILCVLFFVMKKKNKKNKSENEVKDSYFIPPTQVKQENKDDSSDDIKIEYSSVVDNPNTPKEDFADIKLEKSATDSPIPKQLDNMEHPVVTVAPIAALNVLSNVHQSSENKDDIQNKSISAGDPLSEKLDKDDNNTDISGVNNSTLNRNINNVNNNNIHNVDSNINSNDNINVGNSTDITDTTTPTKMNNNDNANINIMPIPDISLGKDNSSTNGSIASEGHNTIPINSPPENLPSSKTLEMIQSRDDNPDEEDAPPSYNEANDSVMMNPMNIQYPISPTITPVITGYGYNNVPNNRMSYVSTNSIGSDMNISTNSMLNGVSSSSMLNNNILYTGNVGPMFYNNTYVNGSFDNNNYGFIYNSLNRNYGRNNNNNINNGNVSSIGLPLYNIYTVNNSISNNLNNNVNNTNNNTGNNANNNNNNHNGQTE